MRVVIADDEKFVLVVLKSALRSVRFPIEIVGEALDGDDAYRLSAAALLDAARHERFTLYLLDIMMPGLNGMDAAREIRGFDKAADIIFLTSSPGFAYDSYSVKALEYLLKPIDEEKLERAISDVMQRRQML